MFDELAAHQEQEAIFMTDEPSAGARKHPNTRKNTSFFLFFFFGQVPPPASDLWKTY